MSNVEPLRKDETPSRPALQPLEVKADDDALRMLAELRESAPHGVWSGAGYNVTKLIACAAVQGAKLKDDLRRAKRNFQLRADDERARILHDAEDALAAQAAAEQERDEARQAALLWRRRAHELETAAKSLPRAFAREVAAVYGGLSCAGAAVAIWIGDGVGLTAGGLIMAGAVYLAARAQRFAALSAPRPSFVAAECRFGETIETLIVEGRARITLLDSGAVIQPEGSGTRAFLEGVKALRCDAEVVHDLA